MIAPDPMRSDAELVRQALAGDDAGFSELVKRYQGLVYGCCLGITREAADAADAAQECFIRFHRNLAQYDPARPLKPYLLTIAANCSRSLLAAKRRQAATPVDDELLDQVADQGAAPGDSMLQQERRGAVRELIAALPATMRDVCSLFYLADCSCREVATILNMNEGAVKTALHRARQRLLVEGVRQWKTMR